MSKMPIESKKHFFGGTKTFFWGYATSRHTTALLILKSRGEKKKIEDAFGMLVRSLSVASSRRKFLIFFPERKEKI